MVNFRLPGPTPLPPRVLEALGRPMISHRGPAMKDLYHRLFPKLQDIHRTDGDVFVWPASGSAGWEIAVVNLLSPGDRVLAAVTGDFGDRFAKVGGVLGLDVRRLDVPWGQAVTAPMLAKALAAEGPFAAVFMTHNETSTGVTNPLPELAAVARDAGALVIVDAVSSASGLPLLMDAWGVDFVLSGSQKAWMCPPGMVITAIGPRCWDAHRTSGYRKFFWDMESMRASGAQGMMPTTPPLSLLFALDEATEMMIEEGVEAVWERHAKLGHLVRTLATEAGMRLFADQRYPSNTVTAISVPEGLTAKAILKEARERHQLEVAAGQGHLSDAMVRIGHMGWVHEPELKEAVESLWRAIESLQGDVA